MVGILKSEMLTSFEWPSSVQCTPLSSVLDPKDPQCDPEALPDGNVARENVVRHLKELRARGVDPSTEDCIIDCDSSWQWSHARVGCSPCLTHSRAHGALVDLPSQASHARGNV